ncbi:hypothetical protein BVG80_04125 [Sphingobacteriales bacterium TSM_CSM]|nr:hypothetical protein BVG80_04125 [Sphingobacteriales bacterium TSM_CSM]
MLLFACEFKEKGKRNPIEVKLAPPVVPQPKVRYYSGTFGKNNIYLYLKEMQGGVSGGYYFVADSIERKITGNLSKEGATIYETDDRGGKIAMLKGSMNAQGEITGILAKMDGTESVQVVLQEMKDSTLYQPKRK